MKCGHCNSEWTVGGESAQRMKNCPFCGKPLTQEPETKPAPETLEEILTQIYKQFGPETLRNGKALLSLHSDLAPQKNQDRRIIAHFVDCGGPAFLEETLKKPEPQQSVALMQLVKRMYEDWFVREDAARRIVAVWWGVLGGSGVALKQLTAPAAPVKKPEPKPEPKPAPKPEPKPDPAPTPAPAAKPRKSVPVKIPANAVCRERDYVINGGILEKYRANDPVIRVPDGVVKIAAWTFGGALWGKRVERVFLPAGLKTIGGYSFCECARLQEISLPEGLQHIEEKAFNNCKRLEGIILPDSLCSIGGSAFWGCRSLKEVRIPGSVSVIHKYAFWSCEGLERVELCPGVKTIEEKAFEWCKKLKVLVIPDSVTKIDPTAFHGCSGITVQASQSWKKAHPKLLGRIPQ